MLRLPVQGLGSGLQDLGFGASDFCFEGLGGFELFWGLIRVCDLGS